MPGVVSEEPQPKRNKFMNVTLRIRPATIASLLGALVFVVAALSFTTEATAGVHKYDVCHVTNVPAEGDGHVISIADPGWPAHEAHGDEKLMVLSVTVDGDFCHVSTAPVEPVAVDDAVTTPVDTPVTIDVLANDSYAEPASVSVQTFPQYGILGINGVGIFEYTPNAGFVGTDSFIYQLCTGSCEATVTITVGP